VNNARTLYTALLKLYPCRYRQAFGTQMLQTFLDHYQDRVSTEERGVLAFWWATLCDEVPNIVRQQVTAWTQDSIVETKAPSGRRENMSETLLVTGIPGLKRFATGKVRDVYESGDALLLVATDRISAFDAPLSDGIPDKGRVLTQLSAYWFEQMRGQAASHFLTTDDRTVLQWLTDSGVTVTDELEAALAGRCMLGRKTQALPLECVVRGYLAGSLWKEYVASGGESRAVTLHGIALPAGLRQCERLPEPIFTPATKAETGHDLNISMAEAAQIIGGERAQRLAAVSIALYTAAAARARQNGIIIADTKFEFGLGNEGELIWIDEALTPDSSRFWDADRYQPGRSQPSYDKQFVRDWLESSDWNKEAPAPVLPPDVVVRTSEKYREAYRRLAGQPLANVP
jgi:phosphoribosylaminoimidazole-succinocarboxamide synthase